eukprot:3202934-Rhodomonas_salina.1
MSGQTPTSDLLLMVAAYDAWSQLCGQCAALPLISRPAAGHARPAHGRWPRDRTQVLPERTDSDPDPRHSAAIPAPS